MAELPEGFVLDAGGPPEGFVIDQEPKTIAQHLNLPKPIVDASNEAQRTTSEAIGSAKQDLGESLTPRQAAPDEGFWEGYGRDILETPARFGKFVRGAATAAGVPLAPAYGAAKSLIGRPMASALHTAGEYINPEVAAKQTPEGIYEDIREDVGSALGATKSSPGKIPKAPLKGPVDVYTNNPTGGATKTTLPEPSLANIKTASQAGYKHPEVAAVEIAPQAVRGLANVIEGDLVKAGFHPSAGLGDKTFQAIDRMRPRVGANAPVTISDLDNTRRTLGRIAKEKDAQGQMTQEAAAAAKAIDHIDDFLPNLKQSDLHAGNAAKANSILQNARKDWAAYKRGSLVEMLEENAGKMAGSNYYGGNLNNNIRQAFRPYGKFRYQKIPGWTDESKTALDRVVSGGPKTSLANMARNAGRLAPDTKLGIAAHIGAAAFTAGKSAPIAVAGYAAKKLGIALTKRNVSKLREILIRDSALQQARQAAMTPKTGLGARLAPLGGTQIPEHQREVPTATINPYAP